MKVYLVDFENVKSKGLSGIDMLTENDNVIIFYSENSDTISFEMHQKVLGSKAEVEYFKVHVGGKNALDFQLSTLLGYLVGRDEYTHIFVISNDRGFDFLHEFWHGKYVASPSCTVYRTKTILSAVNYAKSNGTYEEVLEEDQQEENEEYEEIDNIEVQGEQVKEEENETNELIGSEEDIQNVVKSPYYDQLEQLLKDRDLSSEDIENISKLLEDSNTKEEFHNLLAKAYKGDATEIYKMLRPRYLKLKSIYGNKPQNIEENTEKIVDTEESEESAAYNGVISVKLSQILADKCTDEEMKKVEEVFVNASTLQQLYIKMIKEFRKKKGCEIYNAVREEYANQHRSH